MVVPEQYLLFAERKPKILIHGGSEQLDLQGYSRVFDNRCMYHPHKHSKPNGRFNDDGYDETGHP